MAIKQITLNTEPHVAEVGPYRLLFTPEVYGDQFLDAYASLQEVQREFGDGDLSTLSGDKLRGLYGELRGFLTRLMTPEGAAEFNRFEIVWRGDRSGPYASRTEAEMYADSLAADATVEDLSIRLPDRVLVELMEWVVELYGGGGSRPTGSSNASARASSTAGTRGKAASRSRASTPAAGR